MDEKQVSSLSSSSQFKVYTVEKSDDTMGEIPTTATSNE